MIEVHNLVKTFKGIPAIEKLTLEVRKGEIMGLLGSNGAGKSTTINMLLGFLEPDSGSIKVNGLNAYDHSVETRKIVGYIPENVNLYPYLTGIENLNYFCRLADLRYSQNELREFLSICGLHQDAQEKKVSNYSKGMRQKVGIAIAYAKKAQVYLLDEPASGLDPIASNELSELLKKLAEEGAAILMASHDIFRVREVCHRIGILRQGKLIKEIQSTEVSANELEALYLKFMNN
ncbi:MAG: ABC transporter ATP-binding protein [Crocinitomicaceae bacterium]|nr:ABC transporter ATP-binding protein [Crocinitomicaceae bacterium]